MKLIINNLKMNFTLPEVITYEKELSHINTKNKLIICPSYPYLSYFQGNNYELGSQNVAETDDRQLTGEVSAIQLKSLDVKYSLVGHLERRINLKEDINQIIDKIRVLNKYNIIPILCVGTINSEISEYDSIKYDLDSLYQKQIDLSKIIIAYEPLSSIGTGIIPDLEHIADIIKFIKNWFITKYNINVNVVYGGSVSPSNIDRLNMITKLDGYLLGNTSLNTNNLKMILEKMEV